MRFRRRAQIRGIDFSMALIIFMLVMTQILIMTSNLIQTNYNTAQTFEEKTRVRNFAESITKSEGTSNWGTTLTAALPASWNFGLKSSGDNSLDPTKIGRLSNSTNSSFRLLYSDVKNGLNSTIGDKTFAIKIGYTMSINISSITASGTNLNVRGDVTNDGQGLNYSSVWVFGVNGAGVSSANTLSLSNGTFSATLTYGALPSYSMVIAIAEYGAVNQAMTSRAFVNTVTPTTANITLQEKSSPTSSTSLALSVSGASADYNFYALFIPPSGSTTSSVADTATGGLSTSLVIPDRGVVVAVAVSQTADEVGVTAFPTSVSMNPTNTPTYTSNSYTTVLLCRGILITFEFTVWEDAA